MGIMEQPGFFETWHARVKPFIESIQTGFNEAGLPAVVNNIGCGFGIYIGTRGPVRSHHDILKADPILTRKFFINCIKRGLYFHTDFTVSAVHDEGLLEESAGLMAEAAWETVKES